MNKDVIYIDVDDDVTAIIGKIKKAKEKIVALVPPKRTGALQSAVNLRLLERMAKADKKQLVLITTNQALIGLAAAAQIPVAKNLQTKPEVAEVAALIVDDGDDIIDGSQIPVGDHAKSAKSAAGVAAAKKAGEPRSQLIDTTDLDIDGESTPAATTAATTAAVKKGKNRPKIPNFDSYRKKLFFGIGGGLALIGLLVWMFVFAPAATVIITASTSPQPVNASVRLGGTAATDFKAGVVTSSSQQEKVEETLEFEATGQKDVGEKATGTVRIGKLTQSDYGVPAGTRLTTSGGSIFVTDSAVTIPASTQCFPAFCAQTVTVEVTAVGSGTNSNGARGSVTGPDNITGSIQGTTAGGTSKVAQVVSAEDVDRAKGQLLGKSTDDQKKALIAKLDEGDIVIDSSFTVERAEAVSSPAVDQEASTGKATLTIATTYTIQGVPKAELETFLKASLESKIDIDSQKVYSSGADAATMSNFRQEGGALLATINATGSVGPEIEGDAIKSEVAGKKYGEVQQSLESIDGIKAVDVQFSYFWVRTVPNNVDKIKIEFKVENE